MDYMITYYHNGFGASKNWSYGCPVSQKKFQTKEEALAFVKNNPQYTPAKLLEKDSEYPECWNTIKDYRKAA